MNRTLTIASALMLMATTALAAPVETVAPSVGPPTAAVKVSLSGFAASSAVDIFFDTTDLCLAFTSSAGAATCTINVPRDAQPKTHYITALVRGTASGAQKSFLVRSSMPQFHGRNGLHNGVNPYENTLNESNVGSLDVLWTKPIGAAGTTGSPVTYNGIVYVAGRDGKLYAFNALTGATQAGFPVVAAAGIFYSTPAVGGGRVFIGGDDFQLNAYNSANGSAVSGFPQTLGAQVRSPPVLALGNVYVGCNDGKVYGFNATTGAAVVGYPVTAGSVIYAAPTVYDGKLIIGSIDNNIYGFDALTGAPLAGYPITTGNYVSSTAAAAGGQGFVGSGDGKLYGFTLATGSANPGFPVLTGFQIISSPAVANGKVIVASQDGFVYAIRTNNGAIAWSTAPENGNPLYGSPMVANGVVFVTGNQSVHALSLATGQLLWSAASRVGAFNSPVVTDGVVYSADYNALASGGRLTAYSVFGNAPASRLPGGALGVRPAFSDLKPDYSLQPVRNQEATPD